ncbi:type IV pilus secretin PilQ [bacterium]|nr:type IV pilus secretin PilQ [bacterium]
MMHFKKIILYASLMSLIGLVGCTSSQSTDDDMLNEVQMSDEVFDSSTGPSDTASGDVESFDDFEFSESDFGPSPEGEAQSVEEELDFDFADEPAVADNSQTFEDFDELDLDDLQAEDVVQTPEPAPLAEEPPVEEFNLEQEFADETPAFEEPSFESAPAPAIRPDVQITDIRYVANQAGGSVIIEASGAISHQTRFNAETGQYVVEIQGAALPENLKRPYLLKDFEGSFGSINAYQSIGQDSVRVVVQMKPGFKYEPTTQVEGNSLVVVPPAGSTEGFAQASNSSSVKPVQEQSSASNPLSQQSLEEFLLSNQKFYGRPISIQVRDMDIRDVIGFISEESGANIVLSEDVKGNISLKLRKVPWDQALVTVMRTKDLGYVRQGSVLRISTMKQLQQESETARNILKTQKEYAPVKVKVIPVNYAAVDALQTQLKEFLSKDGKVVADSRSNSILVTDREDILEKVSRLITALDVQPNQVMIEGKIVEASESFSSSVGVKWGASGSPITLSRSGGAFGVPLELNPNIGVGQSLNSQSNSIGFKFGTLDFLGSLEAALQLAESDSTAKVLSSPRVVAMNRERAEIGQVGEVISVITTVDPQGGRTTTENRLKVNLKLGVTPQITSDGVVMMDMDVIREFPGPPDNQTTLSRPINSRTAKTKVLVKDGETAVIGGIYQVDETYQEEGVPVLKDIPVLGWLFKSKTRQKAKNELLIFLTPRIMATTGDVVPAAL